MLRSLPPAHRLARINYPPRALAFAFSLLVLEALMIERGILGWVLFFGVLQFLVYPHLAYLYARIANDSKRAELNNLLADSAMLGAWAAQMHFALWPSCALLASICLNNAANGGLKRFAYGAAAGNRLRTLFDSPVLSLKIDLNGADVCAQIISTY